MSFFAYRWLFAITLLEMMEDSEDSSSDNMDFDSGSDTDLEDFVGDSDSDGSYHPDSDDSVEEIENEAPADNNLAVTSDSDNETQTDHEEPPMSPELRPPLPIVNIDPVIEPGTYENVVPQIENNFLGEVQIDAARNANSDIVTSNSLVAGNAAVNINSPMNLSCEEDGQACPICFESWTNSGEHRLVSLKCGHLFGQNCIEKWIKSSLSKAKCPQCNSLAKKTDIRRIFAKSLKVLDTSERDRALQNFSKEQELRRKIEIEKNQMMLRYQMANLECEKLKKELIDHKSTILELRTSNRKGMRDQPASKGLQIKDMFSLAKTLELNKDGGCRVMAVSGYLPLMVVSQPSKLQMFSGFGIKKISTMDFRPSEFIFLHQKEIKDLVFHAHDSLVLTASLDKTAKITNIYSNSVVQTYNLPMEAWSCTWNTENNNSFYVGLKNGSVLAMDTRKPGNEVMQYLPSIPMSPVVGLEYIQRQPSAAVSMSGVLALQLSSFSFYESRFSEGEQSFKYHPLPIEGRFTSLSLEPSTGHVLVSSRPHSRQANINHLLCELTYSNLSHDAMVVENSCSCNVLQTLEGGATQAQITRSKLLLNPGNESTALVCSGDEAAQAALLWDVSSGNCVSKLKADSPILDVCSFRPNHDFCLSTLTKDSLRIYKWNEIVSLS